MFPSSMRDGKLDAVGCLGERCTMWSTCRRQSGIAVPGNMGLAPSGLGVGAPDRVSGPLKSRCLLNWDVDGWIIGK